MVPGSVSANTNLFLIIYYFSNISFFPENKIWKETALQGSRPKITPKFNSKLPPFSYSPGSQQKNYKIYTPILST